MVSFSVVESTKCDQFQNSFVLNQVTLCHQGWQNSTATKPVSLWNFQNALLQVRGVRHEGRQTARSEGRPAGLHDPQPAETLEADISSRSGETDSLDTNACNSMLFDFALWRVVGVRLSATVDVLFWRWLWHVNKTISYRLTICLVTSACLTTCVLAIYRLLLITINALSKSTKDCGLAVTNPREHFRPLC